MECARAGAFVCLLVLGFQSQAGSLPTGSHAIRLHADQRSAEPTGMLVMVRLNGGKPLRLLVDTGATRILVSKSAADKARLAPQGAIGLYGVGTSSRTGFRATAESARIDGFELRDLEVDVVDHVFPSGIDGLLGTAVFGDHVVRLDPVRSTLELLPRGSQTGGTEVMSLRVGHYLLVSTEAKGVGKGWFLLDTGSAFSAVEDDLAGDPDGPERRVTGIGGPARAREFGPLEFEIGGRKLVERNAYALDLSELRKRSGLPVSGLIGFSAIRHSVVTIDYPAGRVAIGTR